MHGDVFGGLFNHAIDFDLIKTSLYNNVVPNKYVSNIEAFPSKIDCHHIFVCMSLASSLRS